MRQTHRYRFCAAALACTAAATAQPHVVADRTARRMARVEYQGDVRPQGHVAVDWQAPTWRPEYEAEIGVAEERSFRLGSGFWARLDTSLALDLGGTAVPPGIWYLGLHRDAEGSWALTLLDPDRARQEQAKPGQARFPPVGLRVPLHLRGAVLPEQPQLDITLRPGERLGAGTLELRWASYALATDWATAVQEVAPPRVPEFAPVDLARARRTDSGLAYEVLTEGAGEPPGDDATVLVRYTGWLADGTLFDSSRGEAVPLPRARLIPGWQEALGLMRPGGVVRVNIPARLGYGTRGAGSRIPPGADLVFLIELVGVR